jgi:hypothetical protein
MSPCPPLSLLTDTTIADLATQDVAAAVAYAECQAKQRGLVAAYDAVRGEIIAAGKMLPQ